MMERDKIKSVSELRDLLSQLQARGEVVAHCHGVFDLIHPGHIRHFKEAKRQGTRLVVTATADRYVNKGVGRPVFPQELRAEILAAIECIDFVAINDAPDAIGLIEALRPNVYVKGAEYQDHSKDVSEKIAREVAAVEGGGGRVHYTNDIVFSSTELLNQHFGQQPEPVRAFMKRFKATHAEAEVIEQIKALESLKVLVIGDAIIDDYQYVDPLGQSGKGLHMVARCRDREQFAGGVFAVANHVASFTSHVTMVTAIGAADGSRLIIEPRLHPAITRQWIELEGAQTLTKRRYVLRDGNQLSKLFETYSGADNLLGAADAKKICSYLQEAANSFDVIIVSDFGNGFINRAIVEALGATKTFLTVNAQINSGNRGYNVVTRYPRADYISVNEPELRLTAHDRHGDLRQIMEHVAVQMRCRHMAVTRGVHGVLIYGEGAGYAELPALTTQIVDRVGAGDSYMAVSALCLAKGMSPEVAALIGSAAAAIDVQIIGNKECVDKVALCKYLTALLK